MMKYITVFAFVFCIFSMDIQAQERYGNTFNIGLGIGGYTGYYNYVGQSIPVISLDYEFDVAPYFTVAPFISVYTFSRNYRWDNNNTVYRYRQTVIPIGAKATYYFDDILNASSKWDFYAAGSLGFAVVRSRWDDGYGGDRNVYRDGNPLFFNLHIGAEYHINDQYGVFLDLSSGVSTIGLAIHRFN